jgi:hypothetical protein
MLPVVAASFGKRFESRLTPSLWLIAVSLLIAAGWRHWTRSRSAESILDRRIANVDFDGTPMHEALHQLAASAGTTIFPDPNFLAGSEEWDTPVYLHLHDVALGAVFDRLKGNLSYNALEQRDGRLYLREFANMPKVARVYDVHDLVDRWAASPYSFDEGQPGGIGAGAATVGPISQSRTADLTDGLARAIAEEIEPHEWVDDDGGSMYSIISVGACLYVTAPQPLQEKTLKFLKQLRAIEARDAVP